MTQTHNQSSSDAKNLPIPERTSDLSINIGNQTFCAQAGCTREKDGVVREISHLVWGANPTGSAYAVKVEEKDVIFKRK